jgi:hypothetical protein
MPGWTDLLQNPVQKLESVVLPTNSENLWFLPAGSGATASPTPDEVQARLKAAQEQYDFVLVVGGPVLEDASGLELLPYVGCVLLLVRENETRTNDLRDAQEALALCKASNVRIVLTSPLHGESNFLPQTSAQRVPQRQAAPKLVPE